MLLVVAGLVNPLSDNPKPFATWLLFPFEKVVFIFKAKFEQETTILYTVYLFLHARLTSRAPFKGALLIEADNRSPSQQRQLGQTWSGRTLAQ